MVSSVIPVHGRCGIDAEDRAPGPMYRRKNQQQVEFESFHISFGGRLRSDNRWVKLSKIIS